MTVSVWAESRRNCVVCEVQKNEYEWKQEWVGWRARPGRVSGKLWRKGRWVDLTDGGHRAHLWTSTSSFYGSRPWLVSWRNPFFLEEKMQFFPKAVFCHLNESGLLEPYCFSLKCLYFLFPRSCFPKPQSSSMPVSSYSSLAILPENPVRQGMRGQPSRVKLWPLSLETREQCETPPQLCCHFVQRKFTLLHSKPECTFSVQNLPRFGHAWKDISTNTWNHSPKSLPQRGFFSKFIETGMTSITKFTSAWVRSVYFCTNNKIVLANKHNIQSNISSSHTPLKKKPLHNSREKILPCPPKEVFTGWPAPSQFWDVKGIPSANWNDEQATPPLPHPLNTQSRKRMSSRSAFA